MTAEELQQNLSEIRTKIEQAAEKAHRDPKEITLIGVSKTKPNEYIISALEAGLLHFGENRMQELQSKMDEIAFPGVEWHFIGNIQSNKIRFIADKVHWIHSVDKKKYLKEINKRAKSADRTINVLIQLNISGEDQKGGCTEEQLAEMLEYATSLDHIQVRGLMGMATFADDPESVRGEFKKLREIRDRHIGMEAGNISLQELSMGMSNDFHVAIEEGATMVRIGSSIFGARN